MCRARVAHSESVLKAILFTGTHGHELTPIAGKLSEDTDIPDRDVAWRNQPHTEQVADPLGILLVILIALDSGNPLGIGNDDIDGSCLKDIPDRNPVLAGALHTDVLAVVGKEPLLEVEQATVIRGEALLLVFRQDTVGRSDDCGDEKGFVDIDAAAYRVNQTHVHPPF